MAIICATDIWKVESTMSRLGPSYRKEEVTVDMLMTDENNDFLKAAGYMSPIHVEMQCIIELILYVFQESTFDRQVKAMIKTQGLSLLETADYDAGKGVKSSIHRAIWKVVHQIVAPSVVYGNT